MKKDKLIEQIGEKLGFIFSYFLFTTVIILIFTKRLHEMNYLHFIGMTLLITISGAMIKGFLK